MQKIFLERFVFFIVVPIFLLLCVTIPVISYTSELDEMKNQEIMLASFEDALEREVSDGAYRLSQFLLANNNQIINLMVDYYSDDDPPTYEEFTELTESLSFLTAAYLRVEGIEFYYTNGEIYSHKSYGILDYEEVQEFSWYTAAKETPNQIYVGVDWASEFLLSLSASEKATKRELVFIISPDNYDSKNQLDVIFMLMECNTFDSLLELEDTDYSAYIINESGEILLQSDDKYVDELLENGSENMEGTFSALSAEINLTDWELVLVRDKSENTQTYIQGVAIIVLIILGIFAVFFSFARDFLRAIANPVSDLSKEMNALNLETSKIEVQEKVPNEIKVIQEQFNVMLDRIQDLVDENKEKEFARYREELKALQFQINPHFLSNTLNTIKFMAQVAKFDSIREMTDSLMQIMDCSFRNHNSLHTLEEEKAILEAYGYIMRIRYAESFDIRIELEDACKTYLIPKLILQPFVENALFHGLEDYTEDGIVEIKIEKYQEKIRLVIQDNGRGMPEEMIDQIYQGYETKEGRVGVTNVMRRLNLYYEELFEYKIASELGVGTRIELYVPIQEEEVCTKC